MGERLVSLLQHIGQNSKAAKAVQVRLELGDWVWFQTTIGRER